MRKKVFAVAGIVLTSLWFASGASADKGDAAKGKAAFTKSCTSCHGITGKADGPASAAMKSQLKDMSDKAYMSKQKDKFLFDIIAKGGTALGKSPFMPPFGASMKEKDIWNIIAYIRTLAK